MKNKKTVSVCLNEDLGAKLAAYMDKFQVNQSEAMRALLARCFEDEGKKPDGKEFDEALESMKKYLSKEDVTTPVTFPIVTDELIPKGYVSTQELDQKLKDQGDKFMAILEDMKPKEPEQPEFVMGELDVNTPVSNFGGLKELVSKRTATILNAIFFYTINDYSPLFDAYPDKIDYDVYNLLLKSIEEYENDDFDFAESPYDSADSYGIDDAIVNDAIIIIDKLVIDSINQVYSNGAVPTKDLINEIKDRATLLMREAFEEETAVSITFEPDNYELVKRWLDAQNEKNKTGYDLKTWIFKSIGKELSMHGGKSWGVFKDKEAFDFGQKLQGLD